MGEALDPKFKHSVEHLDQTVLSGIVNSRMDMVSSRLLQELSELGKDELWPVVRDKFRWVSTVTENCIQPPDDATGLNVSGEQAFRVIRCIVNDRDNEFLVQ